MRHRTSFRRRTSLVLATLALGVAGAAFWQPTGSLAQPGRCLASVATYTYCVGLRPNGNGSRCCWPSGHANQCTYWLSQYPTVPAGKSAWGGACTRKSHIVYH
jgi:hypothetical protein